MSECAVLGCKFPATHETYWPSWEKFPSDHDRFPIPWIGYCRRHAMHYSKAWKSEMRSLSKPTQEDADWDD